MKYLLLIYGDESARREVPPDDPAVALKPWWEYQGWLQEKGWYIGGDALQPTATATTVRERDGKTLTTDGPFAETKEQLAGYYLIECENLDQAIEAASRIPAVDQGSIEVRPVMEIPDQPL
ncbi:MAG TPA: YciI family protein [Actinomycetota bacterium]|nr:YciI family protein [Actinomycetota bacterium]